VVEAGLRVDAAVVTRYREALAVDDTQAVFTDLIVETCLAAVPTVIDISIGADAGAIAVDLVRIGTGLAIACPKVGIAFPTAQRRNQREQDEPMLL
jgi:hypothetical protein